MCRIIADIATGDQRTVDDDITNILMTLIFPTLLEKHAIQLISNQHSQQIGCFLTNAIPFFHIIIFTLAYINRLIISYGKILGII